MLGSISTTLDNIESRWAGADTQALRPMFALLARGQPLAPAEISSQLELAPDRVHAALRFPTVGIDESGCLVELFGFMLRPTWHRVDVEGRAMFCCCALVAHAIPVLTGKPVRITSVDPGGRGVVEIAVGPDGISSVRPDGTCATLPVSAGPWPGHDVSGYFCSHIRHFPSSDEAHRFAAADPRRRVLELDAFHEHAVEISQRIFSRRVD